LTDRRPATNRHLAVDDDRLRGSHPLGVPIRALNAFPGQQVDVFIEAAQRNAEATLAPR
jgi:hypothetical protein